MICSRRLKPKMRKLISSLLQVERWSWCRNCWKNAKSKGKKSWFFLNSLTCFSWLKNILSVVIIDTKESMDKSKPNKDRHQSIDITIHTRNEMFSCFQPKQVVLVLTWQALMLSLSTILTGTHKTMSKRQQELIESVKKAKFRFIVLSHAIPTRQKCSKEPHKNWVLIRLSLWVGLSSKLVKEVHH